MAIKYTLYRIREGANCDTDYYLVIVKFRDRLGKVKREEQKGDM
jgi:hypothetical protein